MKFKVGDKVLLLPHRDMLHRYFDSMEVLSNTITTITDIGEDPFFTNIRVDGNDYTWGEDSIVYIPDNIDKDKTSRRDYEVSNRR